jgi:SAM-dependent methyltransferase
VDSTSSSVGTARGGFAGPDAQEAKATPAGWLASLLLMDAAAWDARYDAAGLLWSAEPNQFVVRELPGRPAGRAIDLGCGEGRNAVWLATQGWTVLGVDFSAVALAKAAQLAAAAGVTVGWEQADLLEWRPEPNYDLVLLVYVHLPPPQRQALLARAAAGVAPGGSLIVVGHDRRNLADGVGGPQDPALLWTPDEVIAPGFVDRCRETAPRPVEDQVAWDTVVHLVRSG